jgi:hypothetical protein
MDLFDSTGKKIGYEKDGKTVMFNNNSNQSTGGKKFESKSNAQLNIVRPTSKDQKFEPFETIFAWKTTKRFGLININARRMLNQKTLSGQPIKTGFEKWVITKKDATSQCVLFGIYNTKKGILSFDMGTTKCAVNVKKGYFSFITPEALKNKKR